jgi:NADH:ubiquinone oxidoreductase subunit D
MQITPQMALQARVSRMLGIGFAFSIVWLSGVGSLIALIIGLRARRIIMQSEEEISGIRLAWWCIILGGLGIVIGPLWLFHRGWI